MLLLSNADIAQVLDMAETLSALRTGYDDLRSGQATYGPRIDYYLPTGREEDYYQWGNMVGATASFGVVAVRMKSDIVSWPDGRTQEKYCVRPGLYCGLIFLFGASDGAPLAMLQDGYLQHLRVGAAVGIGTDLLARRNAKTVGLLGAGGMAKSFLEALALVRPLESVHVYSPTPSHREAFAREMSTTMGIEVVAESAPERVVRDVDIVASATDAMVPTFDPAWLAPGTHVVCVSRRELGDDLVARADRIVQLGVHTIPYGVDVPMMEWKSGGMAAYLAGRPQERARIPSSRMAAHGVYPTVLEVESGRAAGRTSDSEITLFVATGTQGLQFAAVGGRVFQLASERGLGRELPTEWFLQDIRD